MEDRKLIIKNFRKAYDEKTVLRDVNLSINSGQITGLLGANGAGKTTLLKAVAGIHDYDEGEILFGGLNFKEHKYLSKDFGVLIESKFLNHLTGYENLKTLLMIDGVVNKREMDEKIEYGLELVGLMASKDVKVKNYSYGMRQRLDLAQAILTARTFLILDEPFLGLDPVGKGIVKNAIEKKASDGIPIILSSHDLADVNEMCHKIIVIKNQTVHYEGNIQHKYEYEIYLKGQDEPVIVTPDMDLNEVIYNICKDGHGIERIVSHERNLMDFFYEGDLYESEKH